MGKKVLVLSGSPRKNGNSEILCEQFINGANEVGHSIEKISLYNQKINYCIACDGCRKNKGICVHNDDMAKILEKMIEADVIVMATPVYFYTMDAQMKTLIDRTVARYTEIKNKDFYIIVTAAVESKSLVERTIDGFRGFIDCLSGAKEKGVIYGTGAWAKGEIQGSKSMKDAYIMGKSI